MSAPKLTMKRRFALARLSEVTSGTACHLAFGTELGARAMERALGHLADARLAHCAVHPNGRRMETIWHITPAGRSALAAMEKADD